MKSSQLHNLPFFANTYKVFSIFLLLKFFAPYLSLYLYIKLRKRYWIVEIRSCRKIQLKGWLNTSWSLKINSFDFSFFELCQISLYLHTKFLYSFIFPSLFLFIFSPSSKANIMDKNAKRVWKKSMVFWIFFRTEWTMKNLAEYRIVCSF